MYLRDISRPVETVQREEFVDEIFCSVSEKDLELNTALLATRMGDLYVRESGEVYSVELAMVCTVLASKLCDEQPLEIGRAAMELENGALKELEWNLGSHFCFSLPWPTFIDALWLFFPNHAPSIISRPSFLSFLRRLCTNTEITTSSPLVLFLAIFLLHRRGYLGDIPEFCSFS